MKSFNQFLLENFTMPVRRRKQGIREQATTQIANRENRQSSSLIKNAKDDEVYGIIASHSPSIKFSNKNELQTIFYPGKSAQYVDQAARNLKSKYRRVKIILRHVTHVMRAASKPNVKVIGDFTREQKLKYGNGRVAPDVKNSRQKSTASAARIGYDGERAESDHYDVLRVKRGADAATIKTAYRRAAMRWHPDRNPDDPSAEAKFKKAQAAHACLSDERRRAAYDRFLQARRHQ